MSNFYFGISAMEDVLDINVVISNKFAVVYWFSWPSNSCTYRLFIGCILIIVVCSEDSEWEPEDEDYGRRSRSVLVKRY